MKIEDIVSMWNADCGIDDTALDNEAVKIPTLHGKYLGILMDENIRFRGMKYKCIKMKKYKWLWVTGKMSQEKLDELGWEPFQLKLLKNDIDMYIESDDAVIDLETKVGLQEEKVKYVEAVVKQINNRQWQIRNAIDWRKFESGVS